MKIVERAKLWFQCLTPSGLQLAMEQHRSEASLGGAALNVSLASAAISCPVVLLSAIGSVLRPDGFSNGIPFTLAAILAIGIAIIAYFLATFLIPESVRWAAARALGGKGSYAGQMYFASLPDAALTLAQLILFPALFIPCIGYILALGAATYQIYLSFVIIRSVHKLDTGRAAIAALAPALLAIALFAGALFLFLGIGLFAALLGSAGS